MKKGISFYFGFKTPIEERAKLLKDIGFDNIIINPDNKFKRQNGSIAKQMKVCAQYGLGVSSLHMRYRAKFLPYFWTRGLAGWILLKLLIKDVKVAHKYHIPNVVVHLNGTPSAIGLKRLNKVLKLCEKYNVNLAIENVRYRECFEYTFANIQHPNLKFCYDTGHNHAFEPEIDYLSKYGNKLVCLHLHDNDGSSDQHTLNKYGTINWDMIAKKLAEINFDGSLDYELLKPSGKEGYEEVAREVYRQACELENLIQKYKK